MSSLPLDARPTRSRFVRWFYWSAITTSRVTSVVLLSIYRLESDPGSVYTKFPKQSPHSVVLRAGDTTIVAKMDFLNQPPYRKIVVSLLSKQDCQFVFGHVRL
jgi:hypothetical protein